MSIDFQEVDKDGKVIVRHQGAACFASLCGMYSGKPVMPSATTYPATIVGLEDAQVGFYLEFLRSVLLPARFGKWEVKQDRKILNYTLHCHGWTKQKTLLHLTAFRYVHEFHNLVAAFHKEFGDETKAELLFDGFQKAHWLVQAGNVTTEYGLSAHGLQSPEAWYGTSWEEVVPLPLSEYHERLEKGCSSVNRYFTPPPIKET